MAAGYQLPFLSLVSGQVAPNLTLAEIEFVSGNSNGGLVGYNGSLVFPGLYYASSISDVVTYTVGTQNSDDQYSDILRFNVQFKMEAPPEWRPMTIRKIVITTLNAGSTVIDWTLTGVLVSSGISQPVGTSGTIEIQQVNAAPNRLAPNQIESAADCIFTGNLVQLGLSVQSKSVTTSSFQITKVKLIGEVAVDKLI